MARGVCVRCGLVGARRAPVVHAKGNARMPGTRGTAFLHRSQIDGWGEASHPLAEYPPTPVGEVERRIAEHVAKLAPDRSTVQVGGGSIPQAVKAELGGKRDLGWHPLRIADKPPLIESGVINNTRKHLHSGR